MLEYSTGNKIFKDHKESIIDENGKILFFGLEQFINEISKGDCCFICGVDPKEKKFNNEHIIPNWILRRFNLHSQFITLPNGTKYKYNQYTVPCCTDCNKDLGSYYEKPICEFLQLSYDAIVIKIKEEPSIIKLLFRWLNLIYLKTHLKDKELQIDRDYSQNSGTIGEMHYWEDLHHIHCIARSHYTEAIIENEVIGSILIVPVEVNNENDRFDYADSPFAKGVLLQLDSFCIIAVLNDAKAAQSIMHEKFLKFKGALIPQQTREILANFNYLNINLKEAPTFYSAISNKKEYHIKAKVPELFYLLPNKERIASIGGFLKLYTEPFLEGHPEKAKLLLEIENDKRSFLWDEKGDFLQLSNKELPLI
jgi:hypothetical protein